MSHFAILGGLGRPSLNVVTGPVARYGPLSLCGDLGLSDIAQLRTDSGARAGEDPARMILYLWARHGERTLDRLNGAFAFVIHDASTGDLWAVRDRMGVRPLVYAAEAGRIVVGSTIRMVRDLTTPRGIDDLWVADFLAGQETCHHRTAHVGACRLPPGHMLHMAGTNIRPPRRWYCLRDRIADAPPADLRDALSHAVDQACADRKAATFLSGGLDSSAVSLLSVGEGRMRAALSLRYDDAGLDEGHHIDAVIAQARGGLVRHDIPAAEVKADLRALLAERDQPIFAPGLPGNRHLYEKARTLGYHHVLDGHGGDEVIDGGPWNLVHMAGRGAWLPAFHLAWRQARFLGESPFELAAQLVALRGSRLFAAIARRTSRRVRPNGQEWRVLVDPCLVKQTDLVARVRSLHAPPDPALPESVGTHVALMTAPMLSNALEVLDGTARGAGVTPHYPFYDHRVVELCVAQPDHERVRDGHPRSMLRRAMRGILPEQVRLRPDKVDFLPDFWRTLGRDTDMRRVLADPAPLEGWANIDTLRADGRRLAEDAPDAGTAFRLSRALALALWLELRAASPNLQHKAS